MFDFIDLFSQGRKFKAHGEDWVSLKILNNGCHLAAKELDALPCQVFLVKEDEKKEEGD